MNIFNKVAFQGLKKNRTRTLVTIVGVVLSTALITAVATAAVSLQTYMVLGSMEKYGDWYVEVMDVSASFTEEQMNDNRVLGIASYEDIGYAMLKDGKNADKPYLFIAGFNDETFDTLPVVVYSGRMPANSSEILIPSHVAGNGGVKFSIGDTITLAVGNRQMDGRILNQHDAYHDGEEELTASSEKTYTVVGIYARLSAEEYSAPGYTCITRSETSPQADRYTAFVKLKTPARLKSYIKDIAKEHAYVTNDEVLRFMGLSEDKVFNTLLYSVGGVLIVLVMIGAVFLIYNAFNISLSERMHQFGILMSVGATEKQLCNSVLFEGCCVGAVGIPIGILVGIPSIAAVLSVVADKFSDVLYDNVMLPVVISVPALAAAALISMITILISAYIPAKKAASIPIMDCIRQTTEIKVEAKEMKTSGFLQKIYGLK